MRALITGVTGQDGSYLAEHLAAEGHEVFGMLRGQRHPRREWLQKLVPEAKLIEGDLLDQSSLQEVVAFVRPDVIFNLAAVTFVGMSWKQPALMSEVTGLGLLRLLEAVRLTDRDVRVVQASTSEQFGDPPHESRELLDESSYFYPRSPYGVAKTFAHHTAVNYRESYGMHVSCAIMFNHESPRRGDEFVTRRVSRLVAWIKKNGWGAVKLGNLDAHRDWGWAPDYVQALALMAQRETPDDYVLATGEAHSVRELVEAACAVVDLDPTRYLVSDPELYRPADVSWLCGDAGKARDVLGWEPTVRFHELVRRLVLHDLEEF